MKSLKKILSIFAAFMMVVGLTAANVKANGTDGSITLRNPDKDATYELYKIFDATIDGESIAYYVDSEKATLLPANLFTVGTNVVDGQVFVQAKDDTDETKKAIIDWLKKTDEGQENPNYIRVGQMVTTSPTGNNKDGFTWSGLEYGYYLIVSSLNKTNEQGTTTTDVAITIDSVNPSVTVNAKNNNGPHITTEDKTIVVVQGDENVESRKETVKIGDTVNFKIEFTARNYVTTAEGKETPILNYTISDTPKNMTLNQDYKVTIDGQEIDLDETPGAYEVNPNTESAFTINIPWANLKANNEVESFKYASPATVIIEYSAVLTALDGSNEAKISYNNGSDTTTTVNVTSAAVEVKKVDGSDTTKVLEGAEFRLYSDQDGQNEILVRAAKTGETVNGQTVNYVVMNPTEIADDAHKPADEKLATVITAGDVKIGGLKAETKYYLKETKAPEGYNILNGLADFTTGTDETVLVTKSVENNAGSTLPSTGGMGTTMIYIAGAILMVGAAIIFVTNKRMKHE